MSTDTETLLREMLTRIDGEIDDLRLERRGVEAVLKRLSGTAPARGSAAEIRAGNDQRRAEGHQIPKSVEFVKRSTDPVEQAILAADPNEVHVDAIKKAVAAAGVEMTDVQIRSRISYLNRAGRISNGTKRGFWTGPRDTSGPATETGPEAQPESTLRGGDTADGSYTSHHSDHHDR